VCLNKQPATKTNEFNLPVSESLANKAMSLPMHPYLKDSDMTIIGSKLKQFA
jgi:UDP-2-acetamido-2-deoxy-ribo-hexuluronate aminotransferase